MIEITTARYFARELILDSGYAPIQTSVGAPKFPVGYELAGGVGMLMPYGLLKIEDRDEFTMRYVERLDGFGPDKIRRVLEAIAQGHDTEGVVLLCFENLTKGDGTWCHRRIFADWWQARTGETVRELGA